MLMDILATITAFITVMLLFSLLVTASVQAINAIFNLRFHNLRIGLDVFAEDLMNDDGIDAQAKDKIKTAVANCIPIKSANKTTKVALKMQVRPESVAIEDVKSSVKQQVGGLLSEQNLEKLDETVVHHFKQVELYMAQRFQKISHALSISIGLAVAIIYQINTPDLLNRLSVDPALREAYISQAETLMANDEELKPSFSYQAAAEQAINELVRNDSAASALAPLLTKDLSTETKVLSAIKGQFNGDTALSEKMKLAYEKTVGNVLLEAEQKYRQQWQVQMDQVALLNFKVMPNGWSYYTNIEDYSRFFHNIIGVFISGILISLGAPFWFKNLKTMFDLQERLRKRSGIK